MKPYVQQYPTAFGGILLAGIVSASYLGLLVIGFCVIWCFQQVSAYDVQPAADSTARMLNLSVADPLVGGAFLASFMLALYCCWILIRFFGWLLTTMRCWFVSRPKSWVSGLILTLQKKNQSQRRVPGDRQHHDFKAFEEAAPD